MFSHLILSLLILPSALCLPSKKENEVVNEMLDMVESGMDQDQDNRARFLQVLVTLSQTSNTVVTETETVTSTPSCVAPVGGAFTECTTTATEAGGNTDNGFRSSLEKPKFSKAIVTTSKGNKVDISAILPSKVSQRSRSNLDFGSLDVDGVLGDTLQSGSMSWKEMTMDRPFPTCGRADLNRRPRVIQMLQETTTVTSTATITETATTATLTFSVELNTCTSAGFTFAVDTC